MKTAVIRNRSSQNRITPCVATECRMRELGGGLFLVHLLKVQACGDSALVVHHTCFDFYAFLGNFGFGFI